MIRSKSRAGNNSCVEMGGRKMVGKNRSSNVVTSTKRETDVKLSKVNKPKSTSQTKESSLQNSATNLR